MVSELHRSQAPAVLQVPTSESIVGPAALDVGRHAEPSHGWLCSRAARREQETLRPLTVGN